MVFSRWKLHKEAFAISYALSYAQGFAVSGVTPILTCSLTLSLALALLITPATSQDVPWYQLRAASTFNVSTISNAGSSFRTWISTFIRLGMGFRDRVLGLMVEHNR
jgi:hypothetical protein